MSTEGEKRKLVDLRVVDLRAELEKRGLESKGVKATLIDRLQKVLREEGHDAEEYFFDIEPVKTPKRSSIKRTEQDTESETLSNADDNHDTALDVSIDAEEDVKEEEEDEEEPEPEKKEEEETPRAAECSANGSPQKLASTAAPGPGSAVIPSSAPADECNRTSHALKNADEAQDVDKGVPEANGVDNEDSINLTIGEDEEKLLADEVGHEEDSSSQEKEAKDEGERAASKAEDGSAAGESKKPAGQQEEDKDMATQDDKIEKSEEENSGKAGEKGKSAVSNADQKPAKDDKDKRAKAAIPASSSRNLWVSGLSSSTRATDLKQVFSKYGKVIGAKVVTNARTPGARCYGYVTMATSDDASKCIQHLHRTELHGRMISVERAKGDAAGPPKKGGDARRADDKKRHERRVPGVKGEERKDGAVGASPAEAQVECKTEGVAAAEGGEASAVTAKSEGVAAATEAGDMEVEGSEAGAGGGDGEAAKGAGERRTSVDKGRSSREVSREVSRERARRRSAGSSHYSQHSRPLSRSPHRRFRASPARRPGVLTFTQIREERERQRLRERERELREEERRRREEAARQREIERRQREEAVRLEREKERLRIERERIESERAELMRLERERQRLEREKLEREREELKRQQMRFEEARRTNKRQSDDRRDSYGEDRKRVATERRYDGSQSSRFDENTRSNEFQGKKEYKEFPTGGGGGRRAVGAGYEAEVRSRAERGERGDGPKKEIELPRREAVADTGRGKDSRFERGPSFRVRDERRPESDHRPKVDIRHSARDRYPDSAKGDRYSERSGEWHAAGGPPPVKAFSSLGGPSGRDSWGGGERKAEGQGWGRPMDSNASDRWVSGGGPMTVSRGPTMGPMYSGQQGVAASAPGMGMSISGGPYGSDRFEYKQSMGPMRKY